MAAARRAHLGHDAPLEDLVRASVVALCIWTCLAPSTWAQSEQTSRFIGFIQVSARTDGQLALVTVDIEVDGHGDGEVDRAFVIYRPSHVGPELRGRGEVSLPGRGTPLTMKYLQVNLGEMKAIRIVSPRYDGADTGATIVPAQRIIGAVAHGKTHPQLTEFVFERRWDSVGLRPLEVAKYGEPK